MTYLLLSSQARFRAALAALLLCLSTLARSDTPPPEPIDNLLLFARGAIPVAVGGDAEALRSGLAHAMAIIDGDPRGVTLTPRPGSSEASVQFVFRLPAPTTFTRFHVPNVLETPSPSQTFFRDVQIEGSADGPDRGFVPLAATMLQTHAGKGMRSSVDVAHELPVRWLRLTLAGGILIERDRTFFEFSELIAEGRQAATPLSESFSGKWKGRGVRLELHQSGVRVSGCYDREGVLEGTVIGNLLHATGTAGPNRIPGSFVLSVDAGGTLLGVASTNGAPFRLLQGTPAPQLKTACSAPPASLPGCGDIVHGIGFDFDSARIRPDAAPLLDSLYAGLAAETARKITLVGHTSSEGAEDYNQTLSARRAQALADALVARGMDAGRLATHGAGESRPIADNATEAGRSLNRRVEIACR